VATAEEEVVALDEGSVGAALLLMAALLDPALVPMPVAELLVAGKLLVGLALVTATGVLELPGPVTLPDGTPVVDAATVSVLLADTLGKGSGVGSEEQAARKAKPNPE
jgi:hypothetical protein